jgi:cobalt/nickel transport system permease protein
VSEQSFVAGGHRHGRHTAIETLVHGLAAAMDHAQDAEAMAAAGGFLQRLDPRIKLVVLLLLIVTATLLTSISGLCLLFLLALILALTSRFTLRRLARQAWISVLLFTGFIALPSLVIVPGDVLVRLPLVHWAVTVQGLRSAVFLVGRAEIAATFTLLLILSTPWPHVLKALRSLGVPVVAVAILGMTHRYIFVLLHSAMQMFEARRSRIVGPMSPSERRRFIAAAAGALLARTFQLAGEVHLAMVSRGYRGEVRLLDDFQIRPLDWVVLIGGLSVPAIVLWVQR